MNRKRIQLAIAALSMGIIALASAYAYSLYQVSLDEETLKTNRAAVAKISSQKSQFSAVVDGVEMHTRCEAGWCLTSAHREDLDLPAAAIPRKSGAGFPTVDVAVYQQLTEGTQDELK